MAFNGTVPAIDYVAPLYGIEQGATVINHGADDEHWATGFSQENTLCGVVAQIWDFCSPTSSGSIGASSTEGRWEKVMPFMVTIDDPCVSPLAIREEGTTKRLLDLMDIVSLKGAERELMIGDYSTTMGYDQKFLQGPDGVSVGTGSPAGALALVEDGLANCLLGTRGVIHLTPSVAAHLGNQLDEVDGKLVTKAGSNVIVGAGYAGQGTSTIYGTGPVILHLGPSKIVTDDMSEMVNRKTNEFTLRAERPVAVTWDGCCLVKAAVTLT